MRKIPKGKSRSMEQLRAALAKKYAADGACPLTTGIFTRIAAEFAYEQIAMGARPMEVAPFWRLIEPTAPLAKKVSCGAEFLARMRAAEGIEPIKPERKKKPARARA